MTQTQRRRNSACGSRMRVALWSLATAAALTAPAALAGGTVSLPCGPSHLSFGELVLELPEGWKVATSEDESLGLRTYEISPDTGGPFLLMITPIPDMGGPPEERCARVEEVAADFLEGVRPVAVEQDLKLETWKGEGTCLAFFSATDKTVQEPTPEEFLRITQGMASVGHLAVSFTMLYNDPDPPQRAQALAMLQAARAAGGPGDPTAHSATVARLHPPGRTWSLAMDLTGLQWSAPVTGDKRVKLAFEAASEDEGRMVSVFFEPMDKRGDTAAEYRQWYRKRTLRDRRIKGGIRLRYQDIREWDEDGKAVLRYKVIASAKGAPTARTESMNVFLVHDGLWIDAHLSSTGEDPEAAEAWFEKFRKSLRIVED